MPDPLWNLHSHTLDDGRTESWPGVSSPFMVSLPPPQTDAQSPPTGAQVLQLVEQALRGFQSGEDPLPPFDLRVSLSSDSRTDTLIEADKPLPPQFLDSLSAGDPSHAGLVVEWTEGVCSGQELLLSVAEVQGRGVAARQADAVSLSACLESFLKEEPLGPEDMW